MRDQDKEPPKLDFPDASPAPAPVPGRPSTHHSEHDPEHAPGREYERERDRQLDEALDILDGLTAANMAEAPSQEQRKRRRFRLYRRIATAAFLSLALVGLAIGGIWTQRIAVLETVVQTTLRQILGSEVRATVQRLELDEIVLVNLSVPQGPSIARLTIIPAQGNPASLPLERVEIDGLAASLAVSAAGAVTLDGVVLPKTADPSNIPEQSVPAWLPVRHLVLNDLVLQASTPLGPQTLTGTVDIRLDQAPSAFPLTASVQLESPESASAVVLDAHLGQTEGRLDGQIDLSLTHWLPFLHGVESAAGRLALSLDIFSNAINPSDLAEGGLGSLLAALDGTARVNWTDTTIDPLDMPAFAVSAGGASVQVGGGRIVTSLEKPFVMEANALPENLISALPSLLVPYLSGTPQISVTQTTPDSAFALLSPATAGGWTLDLGATADISLGPIGVSLQPSKLELDTAFSPAELALDSMRLTLLRGPDLPRDASAILEAGPASLPLNTVLSGGPLPALSSPFRLNATVFGPLAGPIWTKRTAISLEGRIAVSENLGALDLALNAPSRIVAEGVTGTGDLRLSPTLEMRFESSRPTRVLLDLAAPINTARFSGAVSVLPISLAMPATAPGYRLSLSQFPVLLDGTLEQLTARLGPLSLSELSRDITLAEAQIAATLSPSGGRVNVDAAGLAMEGTPLLPGAHQIAIDLAQDDDSTMTVNAQIRLADDRIRMAANASIPEKSTQAKRITVDMPPIRLGWDGITLEELLPPSLRAALPNGLVLTGDFGGKAKILLAPDGPLGSVDITISDGAAVTPEGAIRKIETAVTVDVATPPRTVGSFDVRAALELPVLGTLPLKAELALDPSGKVQIEELDIEMLDGNVAVVDALLDPENTAMTGTLRLRRVSLEKALALASVPGVSAEGLLSGLIPIRIGSDGVDVTDGTLASDGAGILRIDNETINQALASNQEQVQLLVDLLKDFRYNTLEVGLAVPSAGNGEILLSLKGNNPAVLDGNPFNLNVNLESDFAKLFKVLRDVVILSSDILRNASPNIRNAIDPLPPAQ